jgi:hypothetical protein
VEERGEVGLVRLLDMERHSCWDSLNFGDHTFLGAWAGVGDHELACQFSFHLSIVTSPFEDGSETIGLFWFLEMGPPLPPNVEYGI